MEEWMINDLKMNVYYIFFKIIVDLYIAILTVNGKRKTHVRHHKNTHMKTACMLNPRNPHPTELV